MGAWPAKTSRAEGRSWPPWLLGSAGWPAGQLCLSAGLFLGEVAASRATGSLLLLSCAYHTLAGALALGTALVDARLAAGKPPGGRNTFGWARAQTAGTLVSAVFLSTLCLALVPEALRRAAEPRATQHVLVLMGIGAVGIPVHLARAGLQERRPRAGGSPHGAHFGKGRKGQREGLLAKQPHPEGTCLRKKAPDSEGPLTTSEESALCSRVLLPACLHWKRCSPLSSADLLGNGSPASRRPWVEDSPEEGAPSRAEEHGPWGTPCCGWVTVCVGPLAVLLYSFALQLLCPGHAACSGRCPGSPCPEAAACVRAPPWLLHLDPALAVALAGALLRAAWPALRGSALVLLQAVPEELDLQRLAGQLRATEGVAALLELCVWQLDGPGSWVATAHVACPDVAACAEVVRRVRRVLWEHGIHRSTVQPDLGGSRWVPSGSGPLPASRCWTTAPMSASVRTSPPFCEAQQGFLPSHRSNITPQMFGQGNPPPPKASAIPPTALSSLSFLPSKTPSCFLFSHTLSNGFQTPASAELFFIPREISPCLRRSSSNSLP
uniref:Cation efflux protein transmembrane domain-containing protein n=1 Tax=Varanus komodoensis TaxID=61221 RepID=A0A8D2IM99_VARKO